MNYFIRVNVVVSLIRDILCLNSVSSVSVVVREESFIHNLIFFNWLGEIQKQECG